MKKMCRFCKSEQIVKKGFRKTENRGKIQRFACKDCGHNFCLDKGFYRMRYDEKIVTRAIDSYISSSSSRKMRDHLKRHDETKVSHVTVLNWVRKYVLKVQNYVDTLNPQIGGSCYADDTEIDRRGFKDHFWTCIDWDTRFINAIHYSSLSGYKEARRFLEKVTCKKLPKYIQTDAAKFYPKTFKKLFYSNKIKGLTVQHRVQNTLKTGKYNVRIETVFSKIKDRVKAFRGLKATWSAPILLAGIILQHNYIEAHTTTGNIPCELTGTQLQIEDNRWLGLIRKAAEIR